MSRTLAGRGLGVFFFNDTATTEIYTLSLHDALPIYVFLEILFGFLEDKKIVSSKITSEILSCKVGSKNMG